MKKIENFLFYTFIFLLPSQLGHFFFVQSSFINGVRIDYLAPALYLTDIIVFLLLLLNLKYILHRFKNKWWILVLIIILSNTIFSLNPEITLFKWLKVVEIIIIFLLTSHMKWEMKRIFQILLISSFLQLFLALSQIAHQGSIQSIFYLFGERYFTISTPGIAKAMLNGVEIQRPYGTFSHPNSLAGFFLLLYTFVLFRKEEMTGKITFLLLSVSALLVLFSFSKITVATFGFINIFYAFLITKKICGFCMISRISVYLVLMLVFFNFQGDPDSITKRFELIQNSLEIIMVHPVTGVGLGAYLVAQSTFPIIYPYFFLQPVHNIYLLIIAELGIPFTVIFFYFVTRYIIKNKKDLTFIMIVIAIGVTGLFDHYWLTLQQNMLLMSVILGFLKRRNVIK